VLVEELVLDDELVLGGGELLDEDLGLDDELVLGREELLDEDLGLAEELVPRGEELDDELVVRGEELMDAELLLDGENNLSCSSRSWIPSSVNNCDSLKPRRSAIFPMLSPSHRRWARCS
jgi:hypothetical protein